MNLTERFFRYITINTQSADSEKIPSTECQWDLIRLLAKDMAEIGISQVRVSSQGYVFGEIPSNLPADQTAKVPAIGFIAHMDTSPDAPGENVTPRIIHGYDGGCIELGNGLQMDPEHFPSLRQGIGKDIIVTDGSTLLGGDDKAGVTEILCAAEILLNHPEIPHGKICIGFTPDEETGNGPTGFDVADFGADFAYTVDGGKMNELQYENFNGADALLTFTGNLIHPGEAKGRMVNAVRLAAEFDRRLPAGQTPADTEGYEGFYHLVNISGNVGSAESAYIVRDHDRDLFEKRKEIMRGIAEEMNHIYGEGSVRLQLTDSYYNMKEQVVPHPEVIDKAKAAMRKNQVEPEVVPIRGGTDGARLSYMGLPCPNLGTGSENHHGPYEFAVIQDMETLRDILVTLAEEWTL